MGMILFSFYIRPLALCCSNQSCSGCHVHVQMIMIVGLPGVGKTTWGINMQKSHPEKRYNIIGTDTLIDKMRVMGLPRKRNYHGRWDVLIDKATKCLNKLFQLGEYESASFLLSTNPFLCTNPLLFRSPRRDVRCLPPVRNLTLMFDCSFLSPLLFLNLVLLLFL